MITSPLTVQAVTYPHFSDVDAEVLRRDEPPLRSAGELLNHAWSDYLRRVLPPLRRSEDAVA